MALPQLSDPGMQPPTFSGTPTNYSEMIDALDRMAGEIEQTHRDILAWVKELRGGIETHVVENGASTESNEFVMAALKLLLLQAELYRREIFDAFAANKKIQPFAAQLTDDERRSIRKSAVRVESIQKDLVAQIKQNADALFAFYDHYMKTGSPPDPWPPK